MYVLVVGGGTIGKGLVEQLSHQKHDVIVIDINKEICEEIYAKFGAVTIIGNVKNSYKIPRGYTVLNVGDRVFLCGTMKDIKEAVKYLSE